MKELLLFILPDCPHCVLALRYQRELLAQHPEWQGLPLRIVDEGTEVDFANAHDYYYVPTWYAGDKKLFEGHAEKSDIEQIFQQAIHILQEE